MLISARFARTAHPDVQSVSWVVGSFPLLRPERYEKNRYVNVKLVPETGVDQPVDGQSQSKL